MTDAAKTEDKKPEEAAKPAPMIFKGVCSDGVLKGKEIEGKLDIKVNVESVKAVEDKPKPPPAWEANIFWAVFLLVANLAVGDPAGVRKYYHNSPQRSPSSSEMLNQSGEQFALPNNTSRLRRSLS